MYVFLQILLQGPRTTDESVLKESKRDELYLNTGLRFEEDLYDQRTSTFFHA